ncbi:hypothetical protein GCM10010234_23190 [Streptomyces hawaiiensis]
MAPTLRPRRHAVRLRSAASRAPAGRAVIRARAPGTGHRAPGTGAPGAGHRAPGTGESPQVVKQTPEADAPETGVSLLSGAEGDAGRLGLRRTPPDVRRWYG